MAWTHEMVENKGEHRYECRFCSLIWRKSDHERGESPSMDELGRQVCHAAERRELIHDVGRESVASGRHTFETQERDLSRHYLTSWSESLVQDGRFAKELADMAVGSGHEGHRELITEFFEEIRSERRRLELGQDLLRIDHPVFVDPLDLPK
jgi:hypothetical protein